MDIFLSDKAFIGIILSTIEVYKDECHGTLLGYNLRGRIVVEYAIPHQSAKRKPSEVEPNWKRDTRLKEIFPQLFHLKHVGYFHSHTQWGKQKARPLPSRQDEELIRPTQIEIIVAINESGRRTKWKTAVDGSLYGTIGESPSYYLKIVCHYKTKKGKLKQYPILCPYVMGFDRTFQE